MTLLKLITMVFGIVTFSHLFCREQSVLTSVCLVHCCLLSLNQSPLLTLTRCDLSMVSSLLTRLVSVSVSSV